MAVYRRGKVWWYKFQFSGQTIRESSRSSSKALAVRAERERRRKMEEGAAGLATVRRPLLFSVASRRWLENNQAHWSESNQRIESYNVRHLLPHFGGLLLTDITPADISRYQAARKRDGLSPRTINMGIGTLRASMRHHRLWGNLQPDVRMLRVRADVGRALTPDEEHRLLTAARKSRSRSLYPAILVSLHTGLRNGELRHLRWRQVDLLEQTLTVGESKTVGGEGRIVPLSTTAAACLKDWRRQYPDALPAHFVFPSERYGLAGEEGYLTGKAVAFQVDPQQPIGSWKSAWLRTRRTAGVECRWHDLRHTFVSRLAEGRASDSTIMALAGHVSRKMMERYSHVGGAAKREAVAALDSRGLRNYDVSGHRNGHSIDDA